MSKRRKIRRYLRTVSKKDVVVFAGWLLVLVLYATFVYGYFFLDKQFIADLNRYGEADIELILFTIVMAWLTYKTYYYLTTKR